MIWRVSVLELIPSNVLIYLNEKSQKVRLVLTKKKKYLYITIVFK